MTFLSNLPTLVLGTSSTKDQRSGSCQCATRSARKSRSSSAPTSAPSRTTTVASGRSPHFSSAPPTPEASGPAHLQLADRGPVPRDLRAVRTEQPRLHRGRQPTLGDPVAPRVLTLDATRLARDRPQRRGLGHPPGVRHVDAVPLQPFHQRAG